MALDRNNNRNVVGRLARRGVRAGRRTSLLTTLTIALTAALVTAAILQLTGTVNSQKKLLERAQHVIYMNLDAAQVQELGADGRVSEALRYKSGGGVEENGVFVQPCYLEPGGAEMDTYKLAEGRAPAAMNEAAADKAMLRAYGLPEQVGTEITVHFLNSEPETFTVVGLTDLEAGGGKQSRYSLILSEEYAENGPQLAGEPWMLMARMKGGANMQGPALEDLVYRVGEEHGLKHQNVNPNNYYIDLRTIKANMVLGGVGFAALLAAVSLLVIYSVFYLSVGGRVRQFGQLRTIGMTQKQLRRMVKTEGWLLWALGAPAGCLIGTAAMLAFGPPNGWTPASGAVAVAAGLAACAAAVRLGIQKPAALAAAASPIEAARYQAFRPKRKGKKEKTRAALASRPLTPWGLARVSFARNLKKNLLTILSLAVGGILFMTAAIYLEGWNLEAYSRQAEFEKGEYVVYFDYNQQNSLENGAAELQLKGLMGPEFQQALRQVPGVEAVTASHGVTVKLRWGDVDDRDALMPIGPEAEPTLLKNLEDGTGAYAELERTGGLYVGMSGMWRELFGKAPQAGDEIEVTYYNGELRTVTLPVVGVGGNGVRDDDPSMSGLFISQGTAQKLFGDMDTTDSLTVTMAGHSHTAEDDANMQAFMSAYPQLRLSCFNEHMEASVSIYATLRGTCMGLAGFIILFSMINLLNTLLSTLMTRRQELAMLAALGMTRRQQQAMLQWENLWMTAINLAATAALGTLSGWGLCRLMDRLGAHYITFSFPALWFAAYAVISLAAPALISALCLRSFTKESLTERLRAAED